MGASSFSPSPITTTPSIGTVSSSSRIASTAAWSAFSFSPRPTHRAAASAAASVTRTSSSARLRSGLSPERTSWEMTLCASVPSAIGTSDGTGGLAFLLRALLGAEVARGGDQSTDEKRGEVADVELDEVLEDAGPRLVEEAVVTDQHQAGEADGHR